MERAEGLRDRDSEVQEVWSLHQSIVYLRPLQYMCKLVVIPHFKPNQFPVRFIQEKGG